MTDASALLGSWRMSAWTKTVVATGEVIDVMGPDPIGYIAYNADGRMMATVFRRERLKGEGRSWTGEQKAELFDTMLAYVADYTLEEKRVVHHVEAAWNPDWETDLSRPFELDGDRLSITAPPAIDPVSGEEFVYRMEFRKV